MTRYKFADLDKWGKKVFDRATLVVQIAGTRIMEKAQRPEAKGGRMPVDQGILRNSLISQIKGGTSLSGPESYVAALAQFQFGQVFQSGWTAAYALRQEHGFIGTDSLGRTYNQEGKHYAREAWKTWPAEIDRAASLVRGAF